MDFQMAALGEKELHEPTTYMSVHDVEMEVVCAGLQQPVRLIRQA